MKSQRRHPPRRELVPEHCRMPEALAPMLSRRAATPREGWRTGAKCMSYRTDGAAEALHTAR